jgi:hypothetical protein
MDADAASSGASEPLDELDTEILAGIAELYAAADPPPGWLDDRVRFAIDLENLDVVVSRLQEDLLVGASARGSERARTVTFDADSLTIMVTVTDGTGGMRVDGWLAPAGPLRVELRLAGGSGRRVEAVADGTGRFVFTGVSTGLAQLIVHPTAGSGVDLATTVVTPSIVL